MSIAVLVALYMVLRWVFTTSEQPPVPALIQVKAPIITPPPRPQRPETVQLTLPLPPPPPTPVVEWSNDAELVAWRVWRLGFLLRRSGGDGGPRLLSLTAPCVWNGPVVRAGLPLPTIERPSGIYALKLDVIDRIQWHTEHVWVTGTIALSGRVVEHEIGYRAERAVVRELRLGVGAHLVLRSLQQLREVMDDLEDRYQVAVNVGQSEREIADRLLHSGHKPQRAKLPFVWDRLPWKLI